jgi:Zn-dependent metalloprotease
MLVSTIFAGLCIVVNSAPAPALHKLNLVKRDGSSVPFYYPESTVQRNIISSSLAGTPSSVTGEPDAIALTHLSRTLRMARTELKVNHFFTDSANVTHVYVDRLINDTPVANHNAAVHIKNGQVTSFSASFRGAGQSLRAPDVKSAEVIVPLEEAVAAAVAQLGVPRDETEASLEYLQIPSGSIVYAHQFQLRDDEADKWLHVAVDAHNGISK